MPAHTPGPWTAIGTDVKTPGHNSRVICWTGQPEVPIEQARANARLIAAAPDLLAALEYVLDCESRGDMSDTQPIRAAIAKATGGSE